MALKHARRLRVGGEIIVLFSGSADCGTSCSISNLIVPMPYSGNLVESHLKKFVIHIYAYIYVHLYKTPHN